jgi:hypothetical protein
MNTANQLIAEIKTWGINDIGFIESENDYGVSNYITFYHNGELVKIRISDHEATNPVRVEKEIMFSDTTSVGAMVNKLEQILFPERFEFRPIKVGEKATHIKNGQKVIISRI